MVASTGREKFPLSSSLVFSDRLNKICISFEIFKKAVSKYFSLISKQKCFNMSCMLGAEMVSGIWPKFTHRLGLPKKRNFSAICHFCFHYSWYGGEGRGRNHPVLRGEKQINQHGSEMQFVCETPVLQKSRREEAQVFRIHLNWWR